MARCFRAIELFENAGLLGFRDAWSMVGYAHDDAALFRFRRQRYRRAGRRVLEGIVDELPQGDFNQLTIHPHGWKAGRDIHLDLPVLYNCSKFVQDRFNKFLHRMALSAQDHAPGLDARHLDGLGNQYAQTIRLFVHDGAFLRGLMISESSAHWSNLIPLT